MKHLLSNYFCALSNCESSCNISSLSKTLTAVNNSVLQSQVSTLHVTVNSIAAPTFFRTKTHIENR